MTSKVLLALHSPIYAPLYLAKLAGYGSFRELEFEYRPVHSGAGDPLVRDVLSRNSNRDCIAAVCDPFRAMLRPQEAAFEQPLIMGGVIQHLFYYLVDHETALHDDEDHCIQERFERVIVHPKYMTGYAVMRHHFEKNLGLENAEDLLVSNTYAGYEQFHYEHLQRQRKRYKRDFAFLTTNPMFMFRADHQVKRTLSRQFQDMVMTSVVVGAETYGRDKARVDGLMDGISEATEKIYADPLEAAWLMRKYDDPTSPFSMGAVDFRELSQTIIHLADNKAYAPECKISADQITRGAEVRVTALPVNPDRDYLEKFDEWKGEEWKKFFSSDHLNGRHSTTPAAACVSYPGWVVEVLAEHMQDVTRGGETKASDFVCLALSLAFIALSMAANTVVPPMIHSLHMAGTQDDHTGFANLVAVSLAFASVFSAGAFWWRIAATRFKARAPLWIESLFIVATVLGAAIIANVLINKDWGVGIASSFGTAGIVFLIQGHPHALRRALRWAKSNVGEAFVHVRIWVDPAPRPRGG